MLRANRQLIEAKPNSHYNLIKGHLITNLTIKYYKVNLFTILSCLSWLDTLEPNFTLNECIPEEYYAPYVKYKKICAGDTV